MEKSRKIEFYITPTGKVMIDESDTPVAKELSSDDRELIQYILHVIKQQFPEALQTLEMVYSKSQPNKAYFEFLCVSRFIRCNFGKFDGLTYDIEDDIMHIEDVPCPIRCECPYCGVICKPKPLGLSKREVEIAVLRKSGFEYKQIASKLGISYKTVHGILQKCRHRLGIKNSKDAFKVISAVLP